MSPPCLATIFEGPNGGVTAPGVTDTTIRIAWPIRSLADTIQVEVVKGMFEHVNRRFELYGRRIEPVFVVGEPTDAVSSRALASEIAAQGVFASLTGWVEYIGPVQSGFAQELARHEVVTVVRNAGAWWSDRAVFDPLHPYVWSVYPSAESNLTNLADFACTALLGGTAVHSLDPGLHEVTRKFGILAAGQQTAPRTKEAVDALRACGIEPVMVPWSALGNGWSALPGVMNQLKAKGATTVICACEKDLAYNLVSSAFGAGYQPEWLVGPTNHYAPEGAVQGDPERAGMLWVDPAPRFLPLQARPWFTALMEVLPHLVATPDQVRNVFIPATLLYDGILVLAAGIQGAGPNLTAHSFAAALLDMQFPNPGAGAAPFWQPSAGFGPGDHSFYDDYAVAWWSASAPAVDPFSSRPFGSRCYLGGGARFRIGSYPADADQRLHSPTEQCR